MALYEILKETSTPEIVAIIVADTPKRAKEMARGMGYGKGYRVEEMGDL